MEHIEEQKHSNIDKIIDTVLTNFEYRCMQKGVNIDMLQHLEDILKNEDIFVTPLNMTANKVKKEKKNLQSNFTSTAQLNTRQTSDSRNSRAQDLKTIFICPLAHCASQFHMRGKAEQHILGVHGLYKDPITEYVNT